MQIGDRSDRFHMVRLHRLHRARDLLTTVVLHRRRGSPHYAASCPPGKVTRWTARHNFSSILPGLDIAAPQVSEKSCSPVPHTFQCEWVVRSWRSIIQMNPMSHMSQPTCTDAFTSAVNMITFSVMDARVASQTTPTATLHVLALWISYSYNTGHTGKCGKCGKTQKTAAQRHQEMANQSRSLVNSICWARPALPYLPWLMKALPRLFLRLQFLSFIHVWNVFFNPCAWWVMSHETKKSFQVRN